MLFAYHPGKTLLHTLDVRCKCVLVCLLSLTVLKAGLPGNFAGLGLFILLLKRLGMGPVTLVVPLKWFFAFLALIFLSRWAATPGDAMVTLYGVSLTRQGFSDGSLVAAGFLNVMLLGLLLTATTRPMEIKAAVQWFFKPIPFIPEQRVAVMMGLALKFMPLILGNARDVSHAVDARCGNLRKNPVQRLVYRTWPLLKKTFQSADNLTLAMQARCYSENRTAPRFYSNGKEVPVMVGALVLSAAILWMR
ncbi:energy-coupling factor transporter transmembrane component T [uncultured Desulfobacter sp.]|uniref:energy-coupling factor transporter transmembrane component T family protein n=1 Tax=uncultured Desulfobacter sp. TaxID=240139 RepID=UPI002AABF98C|nr:energy-coupling factor transporter transmembrane component T [uncultured Desulfobacter sp.]